MLLLLSFWWKATSAELFFVLCLCPSIRGKNFILCTMQNRVATRAPPSASCCGQAPPGAEAPPAAAAGRGGTTTDTAVSPSNGEVTANGNNGDGEAGASAGCQEAGIGGGGGGDEGDDAGGDCGALEEVRHQVAQEYLPVMETIRDQLIAELKGIDKAEVCFSVSPPPGVPHGCGDRYTTRSRCGDGLLLCNDRAPL